MEKVDRPLLPATHPLESAWDWPFWSSDYWGDVVRNGYIPNIAPGAWSSGRDTDRGLRHLEADSSSCLLGKMLEEPTRRRSFDEDDSEATFLSRADEYLWSRVLRNPVPSSPLLV